MATILKTLVFVGMLQLSAANHVAWVAGDFDDCAHGVPTCKGDVQMRKVDCKDVFTGQMATGCDGMYKPAEFKTCTCKAQCAPNQDPICPPDAPKQDHVGGEDDDYEEVGCYKREADDVKGTADCKDHATAMDKTCMTWPKGSGICRSGLPFYRMHSDLMSPALCFSFCISKGLDVFGLVDGGECRCGATNVNVDVWRRMDPRDNLAFTATGLTPANSNVQCEVRVWRYKGHYEDGSIPSGLVDLTIEDAGYADSIVTGREIGEETLEDGAHKKDTPEGNDLSLLGEDADAEEEQMQPKWDRPCWPDNCGPGSGPWTGRVVDPPFASDGQQDKWREYVVINYKFDPPNLDQARKDVFLAAAKKWREETCINLVEDPNAASGIKVGNYAPTSCYLSGMGNRQNGFSKINLGWCNSMRAMGSVIHEIGHAIGMNHEQKRQDAAQAYEGKGPHLTMFWNNIPSRWTPQYTPDSNSYIGSANDGKDDPHHGYAPYDFESIMHYPGGNRYDTVPTSSESLVGNRKHLTTGDINQILDVYQCKPLAGYVRTTTTTTTLDPRFTLCDFEGSLCDFLIQDNTDKFDWTVKSGKTPSGTTGPDSAKNGNSYIYIETSNPRATGDTAQLNSKPLQLGTGAELSFYYHMMGSSLGKFEVGLKESGNYHSLLEKTGLQSTSGNDWKFVQTDLSSFAGKLVSFEIKGTRGSSWSGDIAVDDFLVDAGATAPATPAPTTAAPVTPAPTTAAPVTPAPTTAAPVPPAPTTSAPATTPAPTGPVNWQHELNQLTLNLNTDLNALGTALQNLESASNVKLNNMDLLLTQILAKL